MIDVLPQTGYSQFVSTEKDQISIGNVPVYENTFWCQDVLTQDVFLCIKTAYKVVMQENNHTNSECWLYLFQCKLILSLFPVCIVVMGDEEGAHLFSCLPEKRLWRSLQRWRNHRVGCRQLQQTAGEPEGKYKETLKQCIMVGAGILFSLVLSEDKIYGTTMCFHQV